jgi:hypothetical protein
VSREDYDAVVAVAGVDSVSASQSEPVGDILPGRPVFRKDHVVGVKMWLSAPHCGRSKECGRCMTGWWHIRDNRTGSRASFPPT